LTQWRPCPIIQCTGTSAQRAKNKNGPLESAPEGDEETFAAGFAAPEGFSARAITKAARGTRRAKTFDASITRWANDMFTTWGGLRVLRESGLVVYAEDFPGLFRDEETYGFAKAALGDWLELHGVPRAKGAGAAKGTFRLSGSFHETYQRGENEGNPQPYPQQIRVTLVK